MHAVIRESEYAPGLPVHETREFQEFQRKHANLSGYKGTVVVDAGGGRFLTLTLWRTADDMAAAREVMESVVEGTLDPLMAAPAKLMGTGPVVVSDMAWIRPALG